MRESILSTNQFKFSHLLQKPPGNLQVNFNVWSGEKISEKESHDNLDQLLNIDNLPKNGLHVKVVLKTSSGNVLMRTPRYERTKCLVRQIKIK